ncbi:hypothetical protein Vadar_030800 [Vaccinium darrowii]|uniref:Uncharacterized protein n=1 Tax=Vaccinium darrowii TaxID=229202 RepID=A0ACB7Z078_9ERIC|nr:hypothetical protein Vadar_030800 [Vaccinium darrowii]
MNQRQDAGRRLYEACWSGSVLALDSLIEEDQFIIDRVGSLTCFFNDTPLHLAALRGHLDFTKALLTRKPKLATELDSLRCSPLHLASAEGHVEVVQALLRVNTDVCVSRDQDGRIPLHLAAMKGRVEIIRELLGAKPNSIHEKLSRGETVFHLCVKYNRLEALKALVQYVQSNGMEPLLNSRDDDCNTILHLAAALKQMDTMEYLLGIKSVEDHANVKNENGSTTLDVVEHCPNRDLKTMEIREFLLQAGVRTSIRGGLDPNPESPSDIPRPLPSQRRCKARVILHCIYRFWIKYLKAEPICPTATLTATMAYQAILSPPGGFRQESKGRHFAGRAVLDTYGDDSLSDDYYYSYGDFIIDGFDPIGMYLLINTVVLIASLCTIILALSGFPNHNKFLIWLLIFTVYITISCLAISYMAVIRLVFPETTSYLFGATRSLLYCFIAICGFLMLLHACHFLGWLWNKFRNLVKAFHGCCGPRASENHNITYNEVNPDGSHKCLGNFC